MSITSNEIQQFLTLTQDSVLYRILSSLHLKFIKIPFAPQSYATRVCIENNENYMTESTEA